MGFLGEAGSNKTLKTDSQVGGPSSLAFISSSGSSSQGAPPSLNILPAARGRCPQRPRGQVGRPALGLRAVPCVSFLTTLSLCFLLLRTQPPPPSQTETVTPGRVSQ